MPVTAQVTPAQHALNAWIIELGDHENCPLVGMLDSNKKLSYGHFCFQEDTFRRYTARYNLLPGVESAEIMNFVSDKTIQRQLVVLMLQEPGGWRNWKTTVGKIGMPPTVSVGT